NIPRVGPSPHPPARRSRGASCAPGDRHDRVSPAGRSEHAADAQEYLLDMDISEVRREEIVVLRLSGRLDASTAGTLATRLRTSIEAGELFEAPERNVGIGKSGRARPGVAGPGRGLRQL